MDEPKNLEMPEFNKDEWATELKDLILKNYDMVIADKMEFNPTSIHKSVQTKTVDGVEVPIMMDIKAEVLIHFQLKKDNGE